MAIGLLIGVPLYAANADQVDTMLSLLARSFTFQNQKLQEIAENTAPVGLRLGNTGSRSLRVYSSSSSTTTPSYFGVGNTKTATTTILTIGCTTAGNFVDSPVNLGDVDSLGLFVQTAPTTSSAARLLIQPQVSNDCIDWYDMASLYEQTTTAGSAVSIITLPAASSTAIAVAPGQTGLSGTNFVVKNLASKAIRFNAWASNASTTGYIQATAIERVTR